MINHLFSTLFSFSFYFLCLLSLFERLDGSFVDSSPGLETHKSLCASSSHPKLNSLPGNGWCSLRNIEMNPVFVVSYNKCQLLETPTRNYLIPDYLHITPISTSDIETKQEFIDSYQNFTSTTAESMSASASGGYGKFTAQATFSAEYKNMKKNQVINKSQTSRVSGRYVLHVAQFDEYAVELHPDLKVKLLDAIQAIQDGHLTKASLILELTILSHGTHVITSIDLGGVIVKEDYISEAYVMSDSMDASGLSASASIGYANFFGAKCSVNKNDYTEQYNEYVKNTKVTKISSHGGELFKSASLNISSWVESLPDYLVAVDRSGVALPYVITPRHFPNVNQTILAALRREYVEAIEHFNAVNVRVGCMNQNAANFDYNANIGDKSCHDPPTNFSLGGFFQTCDCDGNDGCVDCKDYVVKNFLTGDTTCPDGFLEVYLNGNQFTRSRQNCYTWLIIFKVCDDTEYIHYEYKAYWCAANFDSIPNDTGLMFGGLFTSTSKNPVTGSKNCPPKFTSVSILQDLTVCTTNDYEFGYKYSVPFGGFFSCRSGNPLASISSETAKLATLKMKATKAAKAACGGGYSQHPAAIDNDCLINYCVKANSFGSGGKEIPIQLPPFQNYDEIFAEEDVSNKSLTFNEVKIREGYLKKYSPTNEYVIVGLGALLGFVVLANVMFISLKYIRRRRRSAENNQRLLISNNDSTGYQSIS